jgi:hypothetical protein
VKPFPCPLYIPLVNLYVRIHTEQWCKNEFTAYTWLGVLQTGARAGRRPLHPRGLWRGLLTTWNEGNVSHGVVKSFL